MPNNSESISDSTPKVTNFFSLPGAGRAERVLGVSQIYKAQAHQTAGGLVCLEVTVPAREGIPLHRHTEEDESFYVLSGQITKNSQFDKARLSPVIHEHINRRGAIRS